MMFPTESKNLDVPQDDIRSNFRHYKNGTNNYGNTKPNKYFVYL